MKIIPPQKLWQWDINKKVYISGITDADEWQVHFATDDDRTALVLPIKHDDSGYWAYIPNQLVSEGRLLLCYLYNQVEDWAHTETMIKIPVQRRPKPAGYTLVLTDIETRGSLREDIGSLSSLTTQTQDNLVDAINEVNMKKHNDLDGRDAADVHPMSSITGLEQKLQSIDSSGESYAEKIAQLKQDIATNEATDKSQSQAISSMRQSISSIKSASESNAAAISDMQVSISSINDVDYNQSQAIADVQSNIMSLIDKDTVLSQAINSLSSSVDSSFAKVEAALDKKQPVGDYITNAVDNLVNYYLKSETYTRSEVKDLIGSLTHINIKVVSSIDDVTEPNVIYLVPVSSGKSGDYYNEYILVNGNPELIGNTRVDLSDYYTKAQTDDLLDDKQPVGNYVTSVNGTTPDKGGNVSIDVQTYTAGEGIDISDSGEIAVTNPMDDGVVSPATTWSSARIAGELEKAGVFRKCGILWDKVKATCTRLWDAAGITTDTSNFGHFGAVNPNYDNPFDDIYPWSERRVCNYDMRVLKTIVADGYDVLDAVTAWEGEETFSYDPAEGLGVGVYTPEFWYTAYDTAEGRVFGVSGAPIEGWYYSEPIIAGRWLGVVEQLDGVSVLGCRVGIPTSNVAIGTLHTYAENANMTVDDVYSWDAETVLQIVEYANMNTQIATGDGVSSLYREFATDLIMEDATDSTVVKVVAANAAYAIPGAIMDIGTSNGGMQVGRRYVISTAADETDETLLCVTLDEPVTVTTANYWSIHGLINVADAEIGSASGYIGTNGRCNAYYRGRATAGNKFQYCLGAHREGQINKIWIVPTRYQAETVLSLDTSVCIDTGCTLPWAEGNAAIAGYIGELALADGIAAFPLCSALGGSSSKPVGDYVYIPAKGDNTVSILGGYAISGSDVGRFYANWNCVRGSAIWNLAASPSTKSALRS